MEKQHEHGLKAILQKYYDSEQNIEITCFWDAGWSLGIGDPANGYKFEGDFDTLDEVEDYLVEWYGENLSKETK